MVRFTLKNISNLVGDDTANNLFVTHISEMCKKDISFNKFISLIFKYSILIFEKNTKSEWTFKSKEIILNQIGKSISLSYNDHVINITKIHIENDTGNINEIKQQLDKYHLGLKKKLVDLYELKTLLDEINLEPPKPPNAISFKKKKIINNDIFIEEFSN